MRVTALLTLRYVRVPPGARGGPVTRRRAGDARPQPVRLHDVSASAVTHEGRPALRLVESDGRKGGGMAIVDQLSFQEARSRRRRRPSRGAGRARRPRVRRRGVPRLADAARYETSTFGPTTAAPTIRCAAITPRSTYHTRTSRGRCCASRSRRSTNRTWTFSPGRGRACGLSSARQRRACTSTASDQPTLVVNDLKLPPGRGGDRAVDRPRHRGVLRESQDWDGRPGAASRTVVGNGSGTAQKWARFTHLAGLDRTGRAPTGPPPGTGTCLAAPT